MWPGFDGKPYTREQWTAHVGAIPRDRLAWCKFITLHNTAAPTLKQWAESGPAHDARIRNLETFYEVEKHWHAGPQAFISRTLINGFSDLTKPGVHSSCFNHVSIGLEMVGDFNVEDFHTGDGAMVAEMAVHAAAVLHWHIGINPEDFVYGERGLHFHIDCKRDNHDCPGKTARDRPALVSRIRARMDELDKGMPLSADVIVVPSPRIPVAVLARQTSIVATSFGGPGDRESSAYGGLVDPAQPQVALPARMPADRRHVRVFLGDKSVDCKVNDIGPWNTNDAYWEQPGRRPAVEQERAHGKPAQNGRVPSNVAGIDMTPAVFDALGIHRAGMAVVDWEFIDAST